MGKFQIVIETGEVSLVKDCEGTCGTEVKTPLPAVAGITRVDYDFYDFYGHNYDPLRTVFGSEKYTLAVRGSWDEIGRDLALFEDHVGARVENVERV